MMFIVLLLTARGRHAVNATELERSQDGFADEMKYVCCIKFVEISDSVVK